MLRFQLLFLLAVAPAFATAPASGPKTSDFITPNAVDFHAVITPPPAADSIVDRAERELMRQLQTARTPDQVALAKNYEELDVFKMLSPVLGDWCTAQNLPRTAAVFRQAYTEARPMVAAAKDAWARPRPYNADSTLEPVGERSKSNSYPSGHGAVSGIYVVLLTEILPEHAADWQRQAELVRWSRVVGGAHYPSDTTAGQILGEALGRELLKSPKLRQALDEVRAELAAHQQKKAA